MYASECHCHYHLKNIINKLRSNNSYYSEMYTHNNMHTWTYPPREHCTTDGSVDLAQFQLLSWGAN